MIYCHNIILPKGSKSFSFLGYTNSVLARVLLVTTCAYVLYEWTFWIFVLKKSWKCDFHLCWIFIIIVTGQDFSILIHENDFEGVSATLFLVHLDFNMYSRPKLYIPSSINIWKKMLTKAIWADKKWASFW